MAKAKEPKNVRVLEEIRIRGKAVAVGTVIAKDDEKAFKEAGEWRNLEAMGRLEQTDDAVGEPKSAKKTAAKTDAPAMPE